MFVRDGRLYHEDGSGAFPIISDSPETRFGQCSIEALDALNSMGVTGIYASINSTDGPGYSPFLDPWNPQHGRAHGETERVAAFVRHWHAKSPRHFFIWIVGEDETQERPGGLEGFEHLLRFLNDVNGTRAGLVAWEEVHVNETGQRARIRARLQAVRAKCGWALTALHNRWGEHPWRAFSGEKLVDVALLQTRISELPAFANAAAMQPPGQWAVFAEEVMNDLGDGDSWARGFAPGDENRFRQWCSGSPFLSGAGCFYGNLDQAPDSAALHERVRGVYEAVTRTPPALAVLSPAYWTTSGRVGQFAPLAFAYRGAPSDGGAQPSIELAHNGGGDPAKPAFGFVETRAAAIPASSRVRRVTVRWKCLGDRDAEVRVRAFDPAFQGEHSAMKVARAGNESAHLLVESDRALKLAVDLTAMKGVRIFLESAGIADA